MRFVRTDLDQRQRTLQRFSSPIRWETTFTASRKGLFAGRTVDRGRKRTPTVFLTDGRQVYALLHIEDTVFSYQNPNFDWESIGVSFRRPPNYRTDAHSLQFLAADPRRW